jgi:hypothetical protein
MKIAIVSPSPIPFAIGGAENLFWGLQNYINENTNHQCELIKLASPESSLEDLIDSEYPVPLVSLLVGCSVDQMEYYQSKSSH